MTRDFLVLMGVIFAALFFIGGVSWASEHLVILQDCKRADTIAVDADTLEIFTTYHCKYGLQLVVPTGRTLRSQDDVPL
jgi:hypothetical protein